MPMNRSAMSLKKLEALCVVWEVHTSSPGSLYGTKVYSLGLWKLTVWESVSSKREMKIHTRNHDLLVMALNHILKMN